MFSFILLLNTVVETRTFCCLHTFYVILELNCFLYYGCCVISLMKRLKQKEPFFSLWSQGCLFRSVRNRINFCIPVILFIDRNPSYAAPVFLRSSCCTRHNSERAVQDPYFPTLTKGECLFVQGMMEINGKASHKNEKKPLENSAPASVPKRLPENNSSTSIFVNHGKLIGP